MIKEDYVSPELAKLLEKRGFSGECLMRYVDGELINIYDSDFPSAYELDNCDSEVIDAPTLQMAKKWLKKKYGLFIQVQIQNDGSYFGYIYKTDGTGLVGWDKRRVKETEKEAIEEAIRYCLSEIITV